MPFRDLTLFKSLSENSLLFTLPVYGKDKIYSFDLQFRCLFQGESFLAFQGILDQSCSLPTFFLSITVGLHLPLKSEAEVTQTSSRHTKINEREYIESTVTITILFPFHCRWSFPQGRHDTRL